MALDAQTGTTIHGNGRVPGLAYGVARWVHRAELVAPENGAP